MPQDYMPQDYRYMPQDHKASMINVKTKRLGVTKNFGAVNSYISSNPLRYLPA